MDNAFAAGDRFLLLQARLLERRLFATYFLGQPSGRVIDVLRGYQNDDGGFGHSLEPDTRCPASLPVYVESALQAMVMGGTVDHVVASRACDFLAEVATKAGAGGGVPLALPVIESYPRAEHWGDWTYQPGLNPTAGLVGLLYRLGVEHAWREEAADYCWAQLEAGGGLDDAHTLSEALTFLESAPDQGRAARLTSSLAQHLGDVPALHLEAGTPGYGLTPLYFAPTAGSRWRSLFTDAQVSDHLDHLQSAQQTDGGWPISWEPPSAAAEMEWRGIVTWQALRTLTSYGRLSPDS